MKWSCHATPLLAPSSSLPPLLLPFPPRFSLPLFFLSRWLSSHSATLCDISAIAVGFETAACIRKTDKTSSSTSMTSSNLWKLNNTFLLLPLWIRHWPCTRKHRQSLIEPRPVDISNQTQEILPIILYPRLTDNNHTHPNSHTIGTTHIYSIQPDTISAVSTNPVWVPSCDRLGHGQEGLGTLLWQASTPWNT